VAVGRFSCRSSMSFVAICMSHRHQKGVVRQSYCRADHRMGSTAANMWQQQTPGGSTACMQQHHQVYFRPQNPAGAAAAGGAGGIIIGLATQQLLTNAFMGLSLVSSPALLADIWIGCFTSVFGMTLGLHTCICSAARLA
jgi:hypothetical protein